MVTIRNRQELPIVLERFDKETERQIAEQRAIHTRSGNPDVENIVSGVRKTRANQRQKLLEQERILKQREENQKPSGQSLGRKLTIEEQQARGRGADLNTRAERFNQSRIEGLKKLAEKRGGLSGIARTELKKEGFNITRSKSGKLDIRKPPRTPIRTKENSRGGFTDIRGATGENIIRQKDLPLKNEQRTKNNTLDIRNININKSSNVDIQTRPNVKDSRIKRVERVGQFVDVISLNPKQTPFKKRSLGGKALELGAGIIGSGSVLVGDVVETSKSFFKKRQPDSQFDLKPITRINETSPQQRQTFEQAILLTGAGGIRPLGSFQSTPVPVRIRSVQVSKGTRVSTPKGTADIARGKVKAVQDGSKIEADVSLVRQSQRGEKDLFKTKGEAGASIKVTDEKGKVINIEARQKSKGVANKNTFGEDVLLETRKVGKKATDKQEFVSVGKSSEIATIQDPNTNIVQSIRGSKGSTFIKDSKGNLKPFSREVGIEKEFKIIGDPVSNIEKGSLGIGGSKGLKDTFKFNKVIEIKEVQLKKTGSTSSGLGTKQVTKSTPSQKVIGAELEAIVKRTFPTKTKTTIKPSPITRGVRLGLTEITTQKQTAKPLITNIQKSRTTPRTTPKLAQLPQIKPITDTKPKTIPDTQQIPRLRTPQTFRSTSSLTPNFTFPPNTPTEKRKGNVPLGIPKIPDISLLGGGGSGSSISFKAKQKKQVTPDLLSITLDRGLLTKKKFFTGLELRGTTPRIKKARLF